MGEAVYTLLAINTLRGPVGIIQSFAILSVFQLINPGIISPEIHFLKWLVFAFPAPYLLVFFWNGKWKRLPKIIVIFGLLLFPFAVLSSQNITISGLKFISFFYGILCLHFSFEYSCKDKTYWTNWIQSFFLVVLISSYLILFTELGFLRNGRGFQGIFNHPQVMGVMGGIMAVWFLFYKQTSGKIFPLFLAFMALLLVFISLARIGLLVILGGWIIQWISIVIKKKSFNLNHSLISFLIIGLIIFVIVLIFWEDSWIWLRRFFLKRTIELSIVESFLESRGRLIASSFSSFKEFPFTGIGMGVGIYSDSAQTIMGIPTSSPVEKGFMPTAILEEFGILGTLTTIIFLIILIKSISLEFKLLFWSTLLINFGEYIFFSMGGLGLIQWILIIYCINYSMELKT